jgi:hypothetical protein
MVKACGLPPTSQVALVNEKLPPSLPIATIKARSLPAFTVKDAVGLVEFSKSKSGEVILSINTCALRADARQVVEARVRRVLIMAFERWIKEIAR